MAYAEPTMIKEVTSAALIARVWKNASAPAARRWSVSYFKPGEWMADFTEYHTNKADALSMVRYWIDRA